ncbi:MAG: tRNA (cytidine(34)-2'-O)-methyltransferase [Clostridiales bacterium]|jgi:tRNA (cytidine/uridine-2'-O-)-methyltransferase|nr:tRNA (cytidine(34)-2'-O)-methyltransferase [Clostridiales bacterium]
MRLNIVLVEPEIPQNTGNISRTCAAIGADLHLVRPLGFSTDDRQLKRAGLDYWDKLNVFYYDCFADLASPRPGADFYFFSTKAGRPYGDVAYADGCYIVFGKETAGLPPGLIEQNGGRGFRIPMRGGIRSLNLSNAVAIVAYEAMRQGAFAGLE